MTTFVCAQNIKYHIEFKRGTPLWYKNENVYETKDNQLLM